MPGPPTPMPLPQSFLAMLIPVIDPQRNGTAMHLQVISYFSRGLPIQAHQNPLDAQHYSRFLILVCLASNFQQLGDGGLISVRECWAHIAHHCSFFGVCRIIYAHLYSCLSSHGFQLDRFRRGTAAECRTGFGELLCVVGGQAGHWTKFLAGGREG